jgi:HEAT repeat protein
MGKLGGAADTQALVKAAKDSSSFVREAVAVSLGRVGGAAAAETLQILAKDEVAPVRDAASQALSTIQR